MTRGKHGTVGEPFRTVRLQRDQPILLGKTGMISGLLQWTSRLSIETQF
jgi:hypothetical protein